MERNDVMIKKALLVIYYHYLNNKLNKFLFSNKHFRNAE